MEKKTPKPEKLKTSTFLKTDSNGKYLYNNTIYERKPNQFISTDKIKNMSSRKIPKVTENSSLATTRTSEKDTFYVKPTHTKAVKSSTEFSIDELPKISPTKKAYNANVCNSEGKKEKKKFRHPNHHHSVLAVTLKPMNGTTSSFTSKNSKELTRCNSNKELPTVQDTDTTDSKYVPSKFRKATEKEEMEEKQFFRSVVQDLSEFNLIKVIGRGTFGKVILVTLKTDPSQVFALKIIKKQYIVQTRNVANVINEKKILHEISNPYIVKLRYSFQNKEKIFMAFDYHNGGELFFHLQRRRKLPEYDVKIYAAEIFVALRYLHSKGIIYRDLKPENIILDKTGHIKLIDFGLAKRLPRGVLFTKSFCGTNEYIRKFYYLIFLAPEVLLNNEYSYNFDWWGFGIIIFELLHGIVSLLYIIIAPFYR